MTDPKLFLGPGSHLIQPFLLRSSNKGYTNAKVPWGHWYRDYPFEILREASYLEIYIMSQYRLCKPSVEEGIQT
jgi:hypothetical protein